jgi:hypothetical protein
VRFRTVSHADPAENDLGQLAALHDLVRTNHKPALSSAPGSSPKAS